MQWARPMPTGRLIILCLVLYVTGLAGCGGGGGSSAPVPPVTNPIGGGGSVLDQGKAASLFNTIDGKGEAWLGLVDSDSGFFHLTGEDPETNEIIDYDGNFIYVDRETINSIEDVAAFILDLMDEQKKGNLPYDLLFLWDSIGSVPCEMSLKSNKNNNEWNAGAMSTQFGNNVNQKIVMSRKESYPYTNTLACVNKVWTLKPESPMGQPKLMNKGGYAMWYDSTFVVTFGNIMSAGTSKIKAIKDGKQVEFAKRTNLQIDKNHVNGVTTRGKIVMTPHGFINDDPNELKAYKNEYGKEWSKVLGGLDFKVIEENEEIQPEAHTQEPA